MITVYSKEEFKSAVKAGEKKIVVKGAFAEELKKKATRQKRAKKGAIIGGGALVLGGLALAPFTGGTSAAASIAGATALTVGSFSLTTAELIVIVGGGIAMTALIKGYKRIKFNTDGSVTIEKD